MAVNSERVGWGTPIGLVILTASLSVVNPGVLLFLPLALLLVAMPPRRPALMGFGVLLLVLGLVGPAGNTIWWFGRGWALILGAWFIGAVVLRPDSPFINRGIAAVFGSLATALAIVASRTSVREFDWAVGQQLRDASAAAAAQFEAGLGSRAPAPNGSSISLMLEAMRRAGDLQAMIYPAMLALGSLSALAVAWWLWRRLALREPRPLNRLREFRFRDELVWLLVAAVVAVVLPLNAEATRAGTNLAAFMGALYTLRGLAVMIALFGTPGPIGILFTFVLLLFLLPVVVTGTLILGLIDTWLDFRARKSA